MILNKNGNNQYVQQLAEAAQLHQQGQLTKAKSSYIKLLKKDKQNAQAHHLLGLIYFQQSHFKKSVLSLKRAISIQPTEPSFIASLANAYVSANDHEHLQDLIQHCKKYQLEHSSISLKLANLLVKNSNYDAAISLFETIAESDSTNWTLWLEYGNCLFRVKNLEQAKGCFDRVLQLHPDQVDALNNLAAISIEQADMVTAEYFLEKVLTLNPKHLIARYNYANILFQQQKLANAKVTLEMLLVDSPDYLDALFLLAKVERAIGNYTSALNIYHDLIQAGFYSGKLFNELGNCYFESKDFVHASDSFARALQYPESINDARFNLAICSLQLKAYSNAVNQFSSLLLEQPDYTSAYAPYLHVLRQSCLWQQAIVIEERLRGFLEQQVEVNIPPFSMVTLESSNSEEQIQIAEHWASRQSIPAATSAKEGGGRVTQIPRLQNDDSKNKKIRLGYLSADLHEHATAILLVRVLELHDSEKFECFAYSYGPDDQSKLRKRVAHSFDHFRELYRVSKQTMIETIKQDQLDILVDLKGFTQNSLSEILLARLAPIQINFLGYPASMGKALVDYIIVDKFIMQSEKVKFEETPLIMPNSYQPTDNTREVAVKPSRASLGLDDNQFVFGAFHQGYKLNEKTLKAWSTILALCPESVLWCLSLSESAEKVIQQTLEGYGIESNRVIFAKKLPPQQHLARLQCADLMLDSFPVNGHTTTSDSLWAGVPVVTIAGDTFISRVAGSLLNAADLTEFICDDFSSYQTKAIEMYQKREELKAISEELKKNATKLPLFDTKKFTTDLESLYLSTLKV